VQFPNRKFTRNKTARTQFRTPPNWKRSNVVAIDVYGGIFWITFGCT